MFEYSFTPVLKWVIVAVVLGFLLGGGGGARAGGGMMGWRGGETGSYINKPRGRGTDRGSKDTGLFILSEDPT